MEILAAIDAASKTITVLKALQSVGKSYDELTLKSQIIELMSDVLTMKETLLEANQKIKDLENQNTVISTKLKFKAEKTIYKNGLRYEIYENNKKAEFPFCPNCETDGKLIRISRSSGLEVFCPSCKNYYDSGSIRLREESDTP